MSGVPVKRKVGLLSLSIAALGVVYGDIGTSPLYALKETFFGLHKLERTLPNVLGCMSLVFWTLMIVISIKYILFMLKADHQGEGGIFALLGIIKDQRQGKPNVGRVMGVTTAIIMFGAALLYGDGIITPAISVLSAYEGLEVATTALKPTVVPLTLLTLMVLFFFQSKGTAKVGKAFGPIMVLWFLAIGAAGLYWTLKHPDVLRSTRSTPSTFWRRTAGSPSG
jgi:KUP system potassium uptake protein